MSVTHPGQGPWVPDTQTHAVSTGCPLKAPLHTGHLEAVLVLTSEPRDPSFSLMAHPLAVPSTASQGANTWNLLQFSQPTYLPNKHQHTLQTAEKPSPCRGKHESFIWTAVSGTPPLTEKWLGDSNLLAGLKYPRAEF